MADEAPLPALERIDRAIARIAAAGSRQGDAHRALIARHDALRARIGDAIAALDGVIADADEDADSDD